MRNTRLFPLISLLLLAPAVSHGQITGTPPFSSLTGGPDVINLNNLNVHYSFPAFGRPGRRSAYAYSFSVDSSVWSVISGTPNTWAHSALWGRTNGVLAAIGGVFYTVQGFTCNYQGQTYSYNRYSFSFLDTNNTSHSFSLYLYDDDPCNRGYQQSGTAISSDGAGVTISATVNGATVTATITLRNGTIINPPILDYSLTVHNGPAYNSTDSNGNRVTVTARSSLSNLLSSITDNLGTTMLSSTGTAPSPVNYTYTSPAGTSVSVVASFVTKTVQTGFGCSNFNGFTETGDVLLDKVTLPDATNYQFTYEPTSVGSSNVNARISSVRLPTSATIQYNYAGGDTGKGIFCLDGSTAGFDRVTPDGTWQYRRTVDSSTFNQITASTTTVTDPQGNVTVINFHNGFETQRKAYQGAAAGTPLETVITCYNGMTDPTQCPTATITGTAPSQVTVFRSMDGGPYSRLDTFYGSYGLMSETDEYDYGPTLTRKTTVSYDATLTNGIVDHPSSVKVYDGATPPNLKSETDYVYDEDISSLHASGASQLFAPTCSPGAKCRGNLTTEKMYVNASAYLTKSFTHYDTGQVYTATDVNGAQTTSTYGVCGNSFLTSQTLPLLGSVSYTWNCTGGVMTSDTDANQKTEYTNYTTDANPDPYFWRPTSKQDRSGVITKLTYPSVTQSESRMDFNGTVSTVDTVTSLDSLGRVQYSQRNQAQGGSTYDSVKTSYDLVNATTSVTVPYAGALKADPPNGTAVTTTSYDAMGRPGHVADGGGGTIDYTYDQNDVLQVIGPVPNPNPNNENTKQKQLEYDAFGRLTSVCEMTSAQTDTYWGTCAEIAPQNGYWTRYFYDVAPNVNSLTVTQNAQKGTSQTRTYIYDMLGRLTQESNPETGTTNYYYDSDSGGPCASGTYLTGNFVKRVDAVNNVLCYSYDQLNRVISIKCPTGSYCTNTPQKNFIYDVSTASGFNLSNTKGHLAEAYTGTSSSKTTDLVFSYSTRGEVADVWESTPHSGGYYHASASYWAHGLVDVLTTGISGMPTITYGGATGLGLDGEGRVTQVAASAGQNPVSSVVYTNSGTTQPIGSITQVTYGSSDYDTFSYDAATGRMSQYKYYVGTTPQTVTGTLAWNQNGSLSTLNITDQLNSQNSQSCAYSHDDLGRIASANCGSLSNQTFTYDPFGNTTKNATAGTAFVPIYSLSTNRYFSVPSCTGGPSYDANGNPNNDCEHAYTWNADNNPRSVDTVNNYTYDALGRLVEQVYSSGNTEVLYAPTGQELALVNGQTLQKALIPLPGGGTAVYKLLSGVPALNHYRHPDWLGSARLSTAPDRTLYFDVAYAPYGETYAPLSGSGGFTSVSFTGQGKDTPTDLYPFLYRQYNSIQSRWVWPDPSGLEAARMESPQTWNRYAYVGNTPLSSTDFLGLNDWERLEVSGGALDGSCAINGFIASCAEVSSFAGAGGGGAFGILGYGFLNPGFAPAEGATVPYVTDYTDEGFQFNYTALPDVQYKGMDVPAAVALEVLGLPSNLPQGTPQKYFDPFEQGFNTALKDLGKKKCGSFFGGQGPATLKSTEYRFLDLHDPNVGAQTNSSTSVFINSAGPYITYHPTPGQVGPFGVYWTQSQFRAFILLHELGHQLSSITGFRPDAGASNSSLNQAQSRQVLRGCL